MTQRDATGSEVGGEFRMGSTSTPVADSCWYMAKPIQYCNIKKKRIVQTEKKRKKEIKSVLTILYHTGNKKLTFIKIFESHGKRKYTQQRAKWLPTISFPFIYYGI